MDTSATTSTPLPQPLNPAQVQTWSVLSHLAFLANFALPFGGVVGLVLIHALFGKQDARVLENSTAALNVEITSWIVFLIGLICMGLGVLTGDMPLLGMGVTFGGSIIAFFLVYRFFAAIINAIKASRGEAPYYRFAVKVL